MSLESVGDISHSILQSELIPQFGKNLASIKGNVKTDENPEIEKRVYSLKDFITNKPSARADINSIANTATARIKEINEEDYSINKNESSLSASSTTLSSEIINKSLSNGYTPHEAVNISKAANAYSNTKNAIQVVSTQSHVVS